MVVEFEDKDGNPIELPPHPGEKLLSCLEKLSTRLKNSGIERTMGLKNSMGENCAYFRKSLDLFIKYDWEELEKLVNEAHTLFQEFRSK